MTGGADTHMSPFAEGVARSQVNSWGSRSRGIIQRLHSVSSHLKHIRVMCHSIAPLILHLHTKKVNN